MNIKHLLLVGLGASFGGMCRFAMMQVLPITIYGLPSQILVINAIGCFFMGSLTTMLEFIVSPYYLKLFMLTGFLGGFTTFSSFALDFGSLVEKDSYFKASLYITFSVLSGITAFFAGLKLTKILFPQI